MHVHPSTMAGSAGVTAQNGHAPVGCLPGSGPFKHQIDAVVAALEPAQHGLAQHGGVTHPPAQRARPFFQIDGDQRVGHLGAERGMKRMMGHRPAMELRYLPTVPDPAGTNCAIVVYQCGRRAGDIARTYTRSLVFGTEYRDVARARAGVLARVRGRSSRMHGCRLGKHCACFRLHDCVHGGRLALIHVSKPPDD